jgi:hypothetical protein
MALLLTGVFGAVCFLLLEPIQATAASAVILAAVTVALNA